MARKRRKSQKPKKSQREVNIFEDKKDNQLIEMAKLNFQIKSKFRGDKQKELSDTIKRNRITFVAGSPGTGKSLIALRTGLELLKSRVVGDILLTTPIIEVSPKSLGALPGDLDTKINNYFQHFYDNLAKLVDPGTYEYLKQSDLIEDKVVNFIRGATFGKNDEQGRPVGTYCILDEAQNLTSKEMKTYISRLGEGSKMVIIGDIDQCDIKIGYNEKNSLEDAMERFSDMGGIGVVKFTDDDIVRDPFLIEIMKRYKQDL